MREKGFSENLIWLLSEMLEETEDRRISLESIEEIILNVEDEDSVEMEVTPAQENTRVYDEKVL